MGALPVSNPKYPARRVAGRAPETAVMIANGRCQADLDSTRYRAKARLSTVIQLLVAHPGSDGAVE